MTFDEFIASMGPSDRFVIGGRGGDVTYYGIRRDDGREEWFTPEMAHEVATIDREAMLKAALCRTAVKGAL